MTVTRNDLAGYGFNRKAHFFGDMFFDFGVDIGESAYGARNSTDGNFFTGRNEALTSTCKFSMKAGKLNAKCSGFSVDSMATANGDCVFMFTGAFF